MSKTFVVAFDGSPAGRRAASFAADQAKAAGAKLLVVHVLEWSPYSFLTPDEIAERHARRAEELARAESAILAPLAKELATSGVPVETSIKYGHVADTICDIAKSVDAAQIFIGRTGTAGVVNRLFGSVAGTLAQQAPAPCTIVP